MTNGNNLVDLNAEHLSEKAQLIMEYFREVSEGNVAILVGEIVMNLELQKRKGDEDLVETLEEIKIWLIPTVVDHVEGTQGEDIDDKVQGR